MYHDTNIAFFKYFSLVSTHLQFDPLLLLLACQTFLTGRPWKYLPLTAVSKVQTLENQLKLIIHFQAKYNLTRGHLSLCLHHGWNFSNYSNTSLRPNVGSVYNKWELCYLISCEVIIYSPDGFSSHVATSVDVVGCSCSTSPPDLLLKASSFLKLKNRNNKIFVKSINKSTINGR